MSFMSSPLGPFGRARGLTMHIGTFILDVYNYLTKEKLISPAAACLIMSSVGIVIGVFIIIGFGLVLVSNKPKIDWGTSHGVKIGIYSNHFESFTFRNICLFWFHSVVCRVSFPLEDTMKLIVKRSWFSPTLTSELEQERQCLQPMILLKIAEACWRERLAFGCLHFLVAWESDETPTSNVDTSCCCFHRLTSFHNFYKRSWRLLASSR